MPTFDPMNTGIRRLSGMVLLSLYLAAATPLAELLKLPVLMEHFREHAHERPAITLAGFILLHYFSGSPRDADYDRDMQLPFKTLELTPVAFAATHLAPEPLSWPLSPLPHSAQRLPATDPSFPVAPFLATPYQPPEG